MRAFKSVFLFLVLGHLVSCNYQSQKAGAGGNNEVVKFSRVPSYAEVKAQVLDESCTECHGRSGGVNLQSYESVIANLQGIYRTSVAGNSMPKAPVPKLSGMQKGMLAKWIEAGAPREAEADPPPVDQPPKDPIDEPPVVERVVFEQVKGLVLESLCLGCHGSDGFVDSVPLENYNDVLKWVIAGEPTQSILYTITADGQMPPKRSGIPQLDETQLSLVRNWILGGALEK